MSENFEFPPKTILLFCDGTGQDALITDPAKATDSRFTNVLRLSRAIKPTFVQGSERRLQIVYYQSGVGVSRDFQADGSELREKMHGKTVAAKIRDAYAFIAQNYVEGDQICLFGFSRGAYTARKISGLINRLGLLPPAEMGNFFAYWKQLNNPRLGTPPQPTKRIPIKCVGIWDTVGAVMGYTNALTLADTQLPSNVEIALHAVSFHENRDKFECTLYTGSENGQTLKQFWFPGAHSDIGGGYPETELADITLAWMVGEIEPFVGVDKSFVDRSLSRRENKPEWGESEPHNAYAEQGVFVKAGIWKKDRLGLLTKGSDIHSSLLSSPKKEGLISIDDFKKKVPSWKNENAAPLNEYEATVKKFWRDVPRDNVPVFEGLDDMDDLF